MTGDDKITIISEIDDLKIKAANHFRLGQGELAASVAEQIIELARKANLESIIREQKNFIAKIKGTDFAKSKIPEMISLCDAFKDRLDQLLKENKVIEAHDLVEEFKRKYERFYNLRTIPSARTAIDKEEKVWKDFLSGQEEVIQQLEKLEEQFYENIMINQRGPASTIIERAWDHIFKLPESFKEYQNRWGVIEDKFIKQVRYEEYEKVANRVKGIVESLGKSIQLRNGNQYEDALSIITSELALLKEGELPEYKEQLNNELKEIKAVQESFAKLDEKLETMEKKFEENQKNELFEIALENCKKIIEIAQELGNKELENKYLEIIKKLKEKIEALRILKKKEQEELVSIAQELENVMEVEDDTVPLIEEFTVKDLLGDLSDDISETLEKVGLLLDEHRVEVKNEISNKAFLISASGETVELDKKMEIEQEQDEPINCSVHSGLENPFDDAIEEAILIDLIPYNFEISSVELNGEKVQELPDKTLTKEGLEINWKLKNIPPKEKIDITYDLRRRVSRTIIFLIEGKIKIIKNHSNLSALELEGLFDVKLPFTNSYGTVLEGLIIEDILPLYYVHIIKEPQDLLPDKSTTSEMGELFKWNIGRMDEQTLNYHYKLIELSRMEEIKINVKELSKEGLDALNSGDSQEAIKKYQEIRTILVNNMK
jgi:hypothetical protein